jgi:hypothetical protein
MIDFTLRELLFVIVTGYVASRCCEQIVDSILTTLYEEEGVEAHTIYAANTSPRTCNSPSPKP